jgi:hypothetical protein
MHLIRAVIDWVLSLFRKPDKQRPSPLKGLNVWQI